MKKLHLGCGQNYLQGYINIDYPIVEHTVQTESIADIHDDLTKLKFARNEISEIRLHHVFEHFRRPQAAGMLATWNNWMPEGGLLRIEVPDLKACSLILINPFSSLRQKCIAERHLFGSHEAHWAAHYEGYDIEMLSRLLALFGFGNFKFKKNQWMGTYNLEIFAWKIKGLEKKQFLDNAKEYLSFFCVDNSRTELDMLDIWLKEFKNQLDWGWSS